MLSSLLQPTGFSVSASYVNVCYNVPELQMDMCKILEFTVIPAALDGQATSKVHSVCVCVHACVNACVCACVCVYPCVGACVCVL